MGAASARDARGRHNGAMAVRTPDPNPGWLSDEDLYEARRRLPMVYVEAIPVR